MIPQEPQKLNILLILYNWGKTAGSVHYDGSNSFLFVNAVKMYQITAKASEIKPYPLLSGDMLKGFTINNMKKTRLRESAQFFSVDL